MLKKLILLVVFSCKIFAMVPPSMRNLGATCYMNATLQCFYQIQPLTDFVLKEGESFYKPNSVAVGYVKLIKKIQDYKPGEVVKPGFFCVPAFNKFFGGSSGQQDAAEFLAGFLDSLADDDFKSRIVRANNPVKRMFYGSLISKLRAKDRPYNSQKFDPFSKLELESEGKNSLKECLDAFVSMQLLTGAEKFYWPEAKEKLDTYKQIKLHNVPPYLIITFKRFKFIPNSKTIEKLSNPVSFTLDLDIKDYLDQSAPAANTKYTLFGIVQHSGGFGGGHYTSYAKHNNQWYFCNDTLIESRTTRIIEQIAANGGDGEYDPYILFYTNNSPIDFTIPYNESHLAGLFSSLSSLALIKPK